MCLDVTRQMECLVDRWCQNKTNYYGEISELVLFSFFPFKKKKNIIQLHESTFYWFIRNLL